LNLIFAGYHQNIRKVDAAGVHPDTYLIRVKRWRRDVFEREQVGRPEGSAQYRFHFVTPATSACGKSILLGSECNPAGDNSLYKVILG
jgi:hypothetical protein